MCVRVCVCVFACVCVSVTLVCMDGWMVDGCMHACMHACMHVCMCVRIYMYIYIYMCVFKFEQEKETKSPTVFHHDDEASQDLNSPAHGLETGPPFPK